MAVVRLSDIRKGTVEKKKSGVVRLADIRPNLQTISDQVSPMTVNSRSMLQVPSEQVIRSALKSQIANDQPVIRAPVSTDRKPTKAEQKKLDKLDNQTQFGTPMFGKAQAPANALSEFTMNAINSAALGIPQALTGGTMSPTGNETVAGKAGAIAGDFVPVGLAYKGANLLYKRVAKPVAKTLLRGVTAGTAYSTAKELADIAADTRNDGSQSFGKRALNVGTDAALFGAGDAVVSKALPLLGAGVKTAFQKFMKRTEIPPSAPDTPLLSLPESRQATRLREVTTKLPSNETPIAAQGNIFKPEPLALPQGSARPQRLRVEQDANKILDRVMTRIKPIVTERTTPPLENPNELAKWVQRHLGEDISLNEIRKLPYEDLRQMSEMMRPRISVEQEAFKAAKELGFDLPALLEGKAPNLAERSARDAQKRSFGVYPDSLPNVKKPSFTVEHVNEAAAPRLGFKPARSNIEPAPSFEPIQTVTQPTLRTATVTPDARIKGQALKDLKRGDELKFAQTVKTSENTAPELVTALNEKPTVGARTSDVLNRQQANDLISKHGTEGLYAKLMAKTKQFSSSETTAAQILAKEYSSIGGEENLSKAIDLVSKTAKGGREMGQAIQALSQWNKLDAEGALLLGTRQLNKGVKDITEYKSLSTAQAAPITEAAQRIETAAETKNLADEVLNIVTNKQAGEALTDAEKATIKRFNDQVKSINDKTKPFLPQAKTVNKARETIKKVSEIEPKARTRDQVVSFLDAKADLARKRIAASRNVGFAAVNQSNPVVDYSIIGASHIAKGVVKLSDYTETMIRDFGDAVKPYINESFTKATNIFRKENGLPTVEELDKVVRAAVKNNRFTAEEAARFKSWASEIGYMSNEFKKEATQDLQAAMKELGDSTLGEKLATIQTSAQLLNAVTMARNITGNAALVLAEKINKVSAVPIDWTISKITGERTIKWLPQSQEKMLRNFMSGTESGWNGVSPTGTLDSYGVHPNVFSKKNPLRYLSKSLGASMQGFDFAAYRVAYGDVLATYGENLGKAQGLTKAEIKKKMPQLIEQLDQRIHDLADEAGRYATFQDDTLLSQGAEMLKRGLNKLTDLPAQKLVERGLLPKSLSTEGFGLGDVLLKYAKTPANLVMRGIDYSPVGFVRAIMELAPLFVNKAKFNQFAATRALSRAITGTLGLTGMGYILADAGILTGSYSKDKDKRSIEEQSGQGSYKVNWSALGRFFTNGLDKNAAKFQEGDHLMDYAWLQPAAISIAMGVNANKAVTEKNDGLNKTGWKIIEDGLLGGLASVLENPMVQGVSNAVDAMSDIIKKQDPTKLKGIAKGVPASFVPTLLNQARTATDNKQRETFDQNIFIEIGNLMKNKVPGLSKTLPVSYDSLGNAREKIQGGKANTIGQYLTAFFSPAKMTEYRVSPEAKIVLDLMNDSGDQNVLPRVSNRYIHISQGKNMKDLRVDLTGEQYSKLQQNVGEMVASELSKKASYLSNPNVSLQNKVDKVKSILTDVGKKAREDIGVQIGYKKKDIKG